MSEHPTSNPPWHGRPLRFTVEVHESDDGPMRAYVAWADDGEVVAECEAGMPADALAGATAALTSLVGRIEVAEGFRRAGHQIAESPPVSPLIQRLAADLADDEDDDEKPPTPGASPPAP